jgi:hypothetical protein
MIMSDTANEFLSEIAKKVAASDAKADADLADILAGRPYKKRIAAPKAESAAPKEKPAPRKARPKRAPKRPSDDDE